MVQAQSSSSNSIERPAAGRQVANALFFSEVEHHLQAGKDVTIPIKGRSMVPFLLPQDRVVLQAASAGPYQLGMVYLFRHQGKHTLHRLVAGRQGTLIMAGDGNLALCESISEGDLVALVKQRIAQDGSTYSLCTARARIQGLAWYYMRWPRRLVHKLARLVGVQR